VTDQFPDPLDPYRERLLEAERLASIGQLAAGVAHEINNPVGYLQSNLRTLEEYVGALRELLQAYESMLAQHVPEQERAGMDALKKRLDADFLLEDLGALLEESRHGVSIIRDIALALRDFARTPDGRMEPVALDDLVGRALRIVQNEVKYVATLDTDLNSQAQLVCDASMISQVVLNLVVNASHAVNGNGRIVVRTGRKGDAHAWLEVEDNGCGIPESDQERIFDAFYTTKPAGKGTGLGLAMIRETVHRHGGSISVTSEPGQGSCFRVTLPLQSPERPQSSQTP
jgi:two-component system, NtrC family, sensor kinase